jgi:hypothetical protein
VKKENICAPALAFVFARHRIGAIAAFVKTTMTSPPLSLQSSCTKRRRPDVAGPGATEFAERGRHPR